MKLIEPSFKLCEEVLDTLFHFSSNSDEVKEDKIYIAIGKTSAYVKRAVDYLIQLEIITRSGDKISLRIDLKKNPNENLIAISIIKKGITNFAPFRQYVKLIRDGKSEKTALKLTIATYEVENSLNKTREIFDKKLDYLDTDIAIEPVVKNKVTNIPKANNFLWIDENGHLIYDEKAHTEQLVSVLEKDRFKNPLFINNTRIENLKKISSALFDLSKLIRLTEELNDAYRVGNYFSVGILTRAILDHIPPIFNKKSFSEVANNHGYKSFKDVMLNLENFSRKIADGILHGHIKRKESLPNATTIDCKNAMDILLGEIINELM